MDHESHQGTQHKAGNSGPVDGSSDGISFPDSPTRSAGEPGYRIGSAQQDYLREWVLLARAYEMPTIEATNNEHEVLGQEARWEYRAR